MKLETFFEEFDELADAPDAMAKIRQLVLDLALNGSVIGLDASKWDRVSLGSLGEWGSGGTPLRSEPQYYGGSIPWLVIGDLNDGVVTSASSTITEEGLANSSARLLPKGVLLIAMYGSIGKMGITGIECATNQAIAFCKPDPERTDLRYLFHTLKGIQPALLARGQGLAQKNISQTILKAWEINLPPLAEQKRIVAKVDELMALCDRLEAQQQERETRHAALARASLARFSDAPTPANLPFLFHKSYDIPPADLRKSILTLAVQGKLVPQDPSDEPASQQLEAIQARKAELVRKQVIKKSDPSRPVDPDEVDHDIPDSWAWVRLVEICELITDGTHLTPKYTESGRMFLSAQNVKPFRFMPAKHRFVSEEHYQGYVKNRKPERGDVLLTRVGAGIGEAATIDQDLDFAIYVSLGLVRPVRGLVFSDYITLWLNSPDGTDKSSRNTYGKGVSQGNLNLSLIRNFLVPLPPLAEQRRIVAKVEQLMALVDALETQLAASRATAANLLSALVAELTSN
jgi:type I restriction enzyme S subunit